MILTLLNIPIFLEIFASCQFPECLASLSDCPVYLTHRHPLSRLVFTYPHTYRALSSASFPNSPLRKTTSTPFFYHHPLIILSVAYSINPSLTRPSPDCDALLPEVPNSSSNTLQLIHTFSFFPFSALDNKTVGIIYHAKIFKILSCSK